MRRWGQGVGFLSEDRKTEGLALNLSLEHNLTLPRRGAFIRPAQKSGFVAQKLTAAELKASS